MHQSNLANPECSRLKFQKGFEFFNWAYSARVDLTKRDVEALVKLQFTELYIYEHAGLFLASQPAAKSPGRE